MAGEAIRVEVLPGQGLTEVKFRRAGRWRAVVWVVVLSFGWLFGLGFGTLLTWANEDNRFMLWVWLAGWSAMGLFFLNLAVWRAFGTESLIARADSLTLMRQLFVFRRPVEVAASEVRDVRFLPDDLNRKVTVNGRRIRQPALEIITPTLQLRCARGIGESEALKAVRAVKQRLAVSWEQVA